MNLPSLFKTPKNKRYNHKNVYYNPSAKDDKLRDTNKKLFYKQSVSKNTNQKELKRLVVTRLIVIFVLLFMVFYFLK